MNSFFKKSRITGGLLLFFIAFIVFAFTANNKRKITTSGSAINEATESDMCVACHSKSGHGKAIVEQWKESKHGKNGVGCLDCHGASKEDADAFEHNGKSIATIVTPKDCSVCHEKEVNEFTKSHHADGGMILGSLDNVLAEIVEGHAGYNNGSNPAAASGCWQCHGSTVALLKDENGAVKKNSQGIPLFDSKTWPNTGIGRINLDGSKGSCAACHNRHSFSAEQARQPENCGKCHLGPDHPQLEIYNESKHGINFQAHKDKMNLKSDKWVVGVDYNAAPTCATCHMSATPTQNITHDVGDRISWTLRPPVSQKVDASLKSKFEKLKKPLPDNFLTWEARRKKMQEVCSQCHTSNYINDFYTQYDNQVTMYNDKYGTPATKIYNLIKAEGLLTPIEFDEELEWSYYYLWHHEGRRARMGASMMAPDYTQWHGNFDLAERFYMEIVPQIKEIIEHAKKDGKTESAKKVEDSLNEILNSEMHRWYLGKLDPNEINKRKEEAKKFRERYDH